jgi:hypothetical protein
MEYLRVKNWEAHQHYKDRNPPWIKLHVSLLDDYEFSRLADVHKSHLMMLWLFASKNNGRIPNDPKFLQLKLGLDKSPDLVFFYDNGWLEDDDGETQEKWPTRYIPDDVRVVVMERAGRKCQACSSKENLEIDHIVPVSKGGTGEESNLQVLCRSCNRKKRVRSTGYADAEQVATQIGDTSVAQRQRQRHIKQAEKRGEVRATRLPPDWQPSEILKTWASKERPDLDISTTIAKFVDHWQAAPGSKGLKLDWDATFRNWVRGERQGARIAPPDYSAVIATLKD